MIREILEEHYLNASKSGSYGGVNRLYNSVKSQGIKREQVEQFLQSIDAYTEHKPFRKFKRRRIIVTAANEQHQMDLADMQKFAKYNSGFKYILTIIDCFSRFAWAIPLKTKKPEGIINALVPIYKKVGPPLRCQTDNGKEFVASVVRKFFEDCNVTFFTTKNDDIKCAMAERLNRTIKDRLWLYMTHKNTYKYIDVLDDVVLSYNKTVHSSTGFAPIDVDEKASTDIRQKMIDEMQPLRPPKYKVGDHVRLAKKKQTFEKGFETHYTEEIFQICAVTQHANKNLYTVKDLEGEPVEGDFYEEELSKTDTSFRKMHNISRILRQRKDKNGTIQYLVRWKGYGPSYDSWENKTDLE